MNAMKMGLLALVSGLLLACGGGVETESGAPELARQEKALCGTCGDSICDPGTETAFNCPQDCGFGPVCGDSVCCDGETTSSCPQDCPLPYDYCYVTPMGFASASAAGLCAVCGDSYCDPSAENSYNCPQDCGTPGYCGDFVCNPNTENSYNCPQDCGSPGGYCGDYTCDPSTENAFNCPRDCGGGPVCGDSVCCDGETTSSCPQDCPLPYDYCYVTPAY
ncbi:hypothetical protein [Corallococcus sp. M7]